MWFKWPDVEDHFATTQKPDTTTISFKIPEILENTLNSLETEISLPPPCFCDST